MSHPRLVVVYHELPYPVNHGGRLDVWRRLQALSGLGASIHLVCWRNPVLGEEPPPADSPLRRLVTSTTLLQEQGKFAHSHLTLCMPGYARRRLVSDEEFRRVLADVRAFGADGLLLEGPFAFPLAQRLSTALGLKMLYRSHNVESRYARFILSKARGLKGKVDAALNVVGVDRLEKAIMRRAHWFFDCSADDLAYWQSRGQAHGEWLPPVVQRDWADRLGDEAGWSPRYDFGYLGNLYQPNNVDGLLWFLDKVVPELRRVDPTLKGFIAGSRPVPAIRQAAQAAGVALIENPVEAEPVLRDARVLINPVFAGSGVNTKCIDMLFTPAGLVATPIALQGLAPKAQSCFGVADTPSAFAQLVLSRRSGAAAQRVSRADARACYESQRVARILEVLNDARRGPSALPVRMGHEAA